MMLNMIVTNLIKNFHDLVELFKFVISQICMAQGT